MASPYSSTRHDIMRKESFDLSATASDDNNDQQTGKTSPSRSARERGIYARPSAAIERGSGFFIPGLEGSRIRFIFGITVLLADAANHVLEGGRPGDWGQIVAEAVTAFYGALLLLQGSIELGVEKGFAQGGGGDDEDIIGSSESGDGATPKRENGSGIKVNESLSGDENALNAIQRMARTITTFTPATSFQFVAEDVGVLFSSGNENDGVASIDADEQKILTKISLDTVSESRGGRVALPSDHPASKLLPEAARRCILVQRVDDGYQGARCCMIIGSDKLLPSFTKNDLRWIGQLAKYNDMMGKPS